jgi:hypothetical protein
MGKYESYTEVIGLRGKLTAEYRKAKPGLTMQQYSDMVGKDARFKAADAAYRKQKADRLAKEAKKPAAKKAAPKKKK